MAGKRRNAREEEELEEPQELSDVQEDDAFAADFPADEADADIDADAEEQPPLDERMMESDLGAVKARIAEILAILADFGKNPNPELTRINYFIELRKCYCSYFGYSEELMEYILRLFGPRESHAFLEAMEEPRPTTIRVNTLRARRGDLAQALAERQVNLEPLDEIAKTCLKVNWSKVPIGATPEYLAGHYIIQSAASLLPVLALSPQQNDRVLDVAAAPGGKTTHIAQLMKNTGLIVANDVSKARTKALFYNCQRMNVQNVVVTNYDGRRFPECLKNFDRVLLDAPCTGLGIISRDPTIKARRTVLDIRKAAHLQRELLRAAIDRCKVGGYIVYSTCSISFEENEAVVDYACKNRYVKVVDTGLRIESKAITQFGDAHLPERIKKCVRVLPHVHNLDGFFIAKLKKLRDGERKREEDAPSNKNQKNNTTAAKAPKAMKAAKAKKASSVALAKSQEPVAIAVAKKIKKKKPGA